MVHKIKKKWIITVGDTKDFDKGFVSKVVRDIEKYDGLTILNVEEKY